MIDVLGSIMNIMGGEELICPLSVHKNLHFIKNNELQKLGGKCLWPRFGFANLLILLCVSYPRRT